MERYHEANLETRPPVLLLLPLLTVLAWGSAMVLLLVPVSHRYFRPVAQPWVG